MSNIKVYYLQGEAGAMYGDEAFCEEYVRYYSNKEFIYLVSIQEESTERFCRIKTEDKNKKFIRFDDWEEYHTYTFGCDNTRVYKQI